MVKNNVHQFVATPKRKLETLLAKVKPQFTEWLEADRSFQKNTMTVAMQVRKAWDLYREGDNEGRVGFARFFDPSIPEDAKTRDLANNATYNRLNYLIDQVAKERREPATPRETVEEKRKRMHRDYLSFRRRFARKPITLADVDELLKTVLAEIWTEEAIKDVLAA